MLPRTLEPEVMDDRDEVRAYDEADFSRVNASVARRALRLTAGARGHALDLGTGPADIPVRFCRLAPSWRVTAIDLSPNMLRRARERVRAAGLEGRIRLLRHDAKDLRGVRGPFDLIFSNSLLHHLDDPRPFWREIRRIAARCRSRRGCAVLIRDLARPKDAREARRLVRVHAGRDTPLLQQLLHQSLLAAFTTREVRRQLDACGLADLRVRRITDRHLEVRGLVRRAGRRA